MRLWICLIIVLALAGCVRDRRGGASLTVSTTLPDNIQITLVSVERPGTYVERARTDLGGSLHYVGIRPGKYQLVLQMVAPDPVRALPLYNYLESDPFDVFEGKNNISWTSDTGKIARKDAR